MATRREGSVSLILAAAGRSSDRFMERCAVENCYRAPRVYMDILIADRPSRRPKYRRVGVCADHANAIIPGATREKS